jgi:uncharacterized membrane protein YtjA (UPF0391 family)
MIFNTTDVLYWEGEKQHMLKWALFFFVIAVVAGLFGFVGIATTAKLIAKILFFIVVALLVLTLIFGSLLF